MDVVSHYLNDILAPTLLKYRVSESFTQHTVEIVAMQMNSLLRHWDDYRFRNTVLLLGLEEGTFYEPPVKLEVRCFVVVTLRNSPIEVIQSESYANAGLNHFLSNQEVKNITSAAVRYFSQQNFEEMCKKAKTTHTRDIYEEMHAKYPVAWMALQVAATTNAKVADYPKQAGISPYVIDGIFEIKTSENQESEVKIAILDGYDPRIDPEIMKMLSNIAATNSYLIIDSFKALTRNIEKLFQIIEFLLTRGLQLVSTNFYLEDGHVEKRIKPLRAGHTWEETKNNFCQTSGLGYQHKQALNKCLRDKAIN